MFVLNIEVFDMTVFMTRRNYKLYLLKDNFVLLNYYSRNYFADFLKNNNVNILFKIQPQETMNKTPIHKARMIFYAFYRLLQIAFFDIFRLLII